MTVRSRLGRRRIYEAPMCGSNAKRAMSFERHLYESDQVVLRIQIDHVNKREVSGFSELVLSAGNRCLNDRTSAQP